MNDLLHEVYPAHNALDDDKALQKLSELVSSKFPSYTVGIGDIENSANMQSNKADFVTLQTGKAVSDLMATKIARVGVKYTHLKLVTEMDLMDCQLYLVRRSMELYV